MVLYTLSRQDSAASLFGQPREGPQIEVEVEPIMPPPPANAAGRTAALCSGHARPDNYHPTPPTLAPWTGDPVATGAHSHHPISVWFGEENKTGGGKKK